MAQPAPMLVAYYVGEANADEKMLRSRLAEQLPEYMVPAHLIALDALPLTANGKLDRNALPLPAAEEQATYCPPRDDREHQLCRLWGEILHVPADELSTRADLFQLGIDSIASIQMAGRLRRELQLDVTLKELLTYRTIASFYDTLLGRQTVGGIQTVQRETGALSGAAPLLPIQQWFPAHDLPHPQQWNQYGLLVAPGMTMARLQCLLPRLVAQHDAFNLRFEKIPKENGVNATSRRLRCRPATLWTFAHCRCRKTTRILTPRCCSVLPTGSRRSICRAGLWPRLPFLKGTRTARPCSSLAIT